MKHGMMLLTVLLCSVAAATIVYPPVKYGQEVTIYFELYGATDANTAYGTAPAADDVYIRKDGGAAARVTNAVADLGRYMSLTLTATEMQAATVTIDVNDESAPKLYGDELIIIPTYGHAAALQAFDLDAAMTVDPNGNVLAEVNAVSSGSGLVDLAAVRGALRYQLKEAIGADANENSVAANSEDLTRMLMADPPTTVAAVTDADTFTITAGSTVDDYYNGAMIVVQDVSDSNRRAVRFVRDFTGASRTVKLDEGLPFLPAAADPAYIYMNRAVGRGRVSP